MPPTDWRLSASRTPPCAGLPGLILGKRCSSRLVATATEDRLNIRHNVQVEFAPVLTPTEPDPTAGRQRWIMLTLVFLVALVVAGFIIAARLVA